MPPRSLIPAFTLSVLAATAAAQNNTTVVQSKGPGAWGANLRLVEELRIGELEGAEEYTFGIIFDMLAGKDGSIFVAEFPASIRMYDSNGKFVKKVGRQGSGPGEYRQIGSLALLADGNIAVRDGQLRRVTILDPEGNFLRSFVSQTDLFTSDGFRVDDAGNFYVKASARTANPTPPGLDQQINWVKSDNSGQVVDTFSLPIGKTPAVQLYGGPHFSRVEPVVSTLSRAGGIVSGSPLAYSIDVRRPGQGKLVIQREYKPIVLAGVEKSEWEAAAAYESKQPTSRMYSKGTNGKVVATDGPTAKYATPSVKPAFRDLRVDEENRIWVERYGPASKFPPPPPRKRQPDALPAPGQDRPVSLWRELTTFDVFESNGRFLGTIVTPRNTSFRAMRGKTIWATTKGELDEAYVVRYRIEPAK